ncbi:MAG TPA: 3-oxoacyl-ACP synthase III [Gemmataceae bacterium]|jgi:3-oxoacyl-[acyl-carrier-protein] synthase-3|nr:3-oxoacyl-ACP synthase III [Gemmataceae bacterium]
MRYSRVYLEAIGYELAPVVISTEELEARLEPLYKALHLPMGQLEALTGISERRWWPKDYSVAQGATVAGLKALAASNLKPSDIDVLIYAGVCREQLEPATACHVAAQLGISADAAIFDVSNACLGVLNGIVEIANRIELGQAKAGLVVSCETAREINEVIIDQMCQAKSMEVFKETVATLTGGSGAVAVLVVDEELSSAKRRQLLGGATKNAPQFHNLCRWGWQSVTSTADRILHTEAGGLVKAVIDKGKRHLVTPFMATDAGSVLKYGVDLGAKTWQAFLSKLGWRVDQMDKVICHQVGTLHRDTILKSLGIPKAKDFSTFEYLGNMGTVSLPLTAALAEERDHLIPGDRVGFMGIGSGLNCMMLGLKW